MPRLAVYCFTEAFLLTCASPACFPCAQISVMLQGHALHQPTLQDLILLGVPHHMSMLAAVQSCSD